MDAAGICRISGGAVPAVTERKPRMDYESQLARGFAELLRVIRDKKLTEQERHKIITEWFKKGIYKNVRK